MHDIHALLAPINPGHIFLHVYNRLYLGANDNNMASSLNISAAVEFFSKFFCDNSSTLKKPAISYTPFVFTVKAAVFCFAARTSMLRL